MYAIIKIQGVQAKVAPEEVLDVPRLNGEVGQTLTFDRVLLVADGDQIKVGQPYLQGVSLTAEVLEHFRARKLRVFKFKRRRDYRRRRGHRDERTRLRITAITT